MEMIVPPCLVQNAQREVGREGKYPLGVPGVSKKTVSGSGIWLWAFPEPLTIVCYGAVA